MLIRYNKNANGVQEKKALVYTQEDHGIDKKKIDAEALRIIHNLQRYGYDAYIVGGAVRDLLIGKHPKDFDIVTSAEPARIRKIFRNSRIIGKRFRLVHIYYGKNKIYEVSTFRSNKEGSVGNTFGTIEEDVLRRDFTLNALYYNPTDNTIIDYIGGVEDIRNRRLRPVINLSMIFTEDPVRMLRAVKYTAITRARIPFLLGYRIHRDAPLIEYTSASRLTEEIQKILMSGYAAGIFKMLLHYHLFLYLQPSAFSFLQDHDGFYDAYFASMAELDTAVLSGNIHRQGDALIYLIRDFLHIITDWNGQPREVYKQVYSQCRHFVLPMNPQRIELEYAVRYCLQKGGLPIKVSRPAKPKETARKSGFKTKQNTTQGTAGHSSPRRRKKNYMRKTVPSN